MSLTEGQSALLGCCRQTGPITQYMQVMVAMTVILHYDFSTEIYYAYCVKVNSSLIYCHTNVLATVYMKLWISTFF